MTAEPIDSAIMELVDGEVRLLGGRCADCGEISFPRADSCPRCGAGRVEPVRLADRGELWSWTIQRFPPPSPPYLPAGDEFTPFGVGYVELPGEVIVETRLTESDPDRLRIGMPMRLTGIEVQAETGTATTFAFTPDEKEGR
ncbi:DNA-binding protein [Mycolicibacter heraklionensis]|uniref:DNA-binding protein n=1 Tax=Mycolicibacter heraklionensis TaxID=512402 RepID=A0ABR5FBA9_9MYCO|nr:OB-fold domain-containing protein [Mycolicibacter heraklionensis]KLO26624.1 DNA-binding protein [Mycolicibacter heraklionensis]